ncbi:MAG: cytochrome c biogenesis protein CcsA [Deltaproteobacteria bacterium]|nr:cytochrome c biogenesis protein CcsA [Deltaproteobacteria bacterium]
MAPFFAIDKLYYLLAALFYLAAMMVFIFRQRKCALGLLLAGFALHTCFLWKRAWTLGFLSPNAFFEGLYFLPWCLGLLSIGLKVFAKNKSLADSIIILIFFLSLPASFFPGGIIPPSPKSQTIFSSLFFFFEVLAQACFILGAWLGLLYLRQQEEARIFHSFLIWGFVFYSLAQVVGAYWSYLGWATPLHWSNRHLQSASLWCFYAAILHLRFLPDWPLRQEARFSILGFFLVLLFNIGAQISERAITRLGG